MKKLLFALAFSTVSLGFAANANAGYSFYWVAAETNLSTEFSATSDSSDAISNWRYKPSSAYFVKVNTFTTYEDWVAADSDGYRISTLYAADGTVSTDYSLSDGLDLVIGASNSTILISGYYGFNGLTYYSGTTGITLSFSENSGLGAIYTINLTGMTISVALSDSYDEITTRILCRSTDSTWGSVTGVDSATLEISTSGYSLLETTYSSVDEAISAISGATVSTAAFYSTGKILGVVYITVSAIPEPSFFGIFAGISALGLGLTRRRRSRG